MATRTELQSIEGLQEARLRVLVLFGGIPLLGQERGNIQVFYALRRMGIDSFFVTNRDWGNVHVQPALDSLDLKWTVASYVDGFRREMTTREWVRNLGRIISGSVTLLRLMRRYKPTHIHICNVEFFITFLPVLIATRVPLIYRLGDVPATHRKAFQILWRKVIVPRVSKFVCVSEYVKRSVLDLGASESKCSVIYSEAPVRIIREGVAGNDRIEKGKKFTVLYAGQLTRDKGVDVLVGAAMRMCRSRDEIEYLIAGDYEWENEFAKSLIENVRRAGLSDRIRFLGYVDALPELFRIADLHVLPSVWEDPLPNVVIEAKSAGISSVVFPSGGVPEVIEHEHEGYICDEKTQESLIAGIEYYADSPGRAASHGENASASLKRLGITRFGELWESIYAKA